MKNRFDEFTYEEMKFLDKAMISVAIEIGEKACNPHLPLINEILDAYHEQSFARTLKILQQSG